jgi:hypothetical protein
MKAPSATDGARRGDRGCEAGLVVAVGRPQGHGQLGQSGGSSGTGCSGSALPVFCSSPWPVPPSPVAFMTSAVMKPARSETRKTSTRAISAAQVGRSGVICLPNSGHHHGHHLCSPLRDRDDGALLKGVLGQPSSSQRSHGTATGRRLVQLTSGTASPVSFSCIGQAADQHVGAFTYERPGPAETGAPPVTTAYDPQSPLPS